MGNDRRWGWSATVGQVPTVELAQAARGVDRRTLRRVRRQVRRGQQASSIQHARLAIAIARDFRRQDQLSGPLTVAFFALLVVLWFAFGVGYLGQSPVLAVIFLATAIWGARLLITRKRFARGARQAERLNLAYLDQHGEPYSPSPEFAGKVVWPGWDVMLPTIALQIAVQSAGFGTLTSLMDGEPLTAGHIAAKGLPFGVLMAIASLTFTRHRNKRAALRAAGDSSGTVSGA